MVNLFTITYPKFNVVMVMQDSLKDVFVYIVLRLYFSELGIA